MKLFRVKLHNWNILIRAKDYLEAESIFYNYTHYEKDISIDMKVVSTEGEPEIILSEYNGY